MHAPNTEAELMTGPRRLSEDVLRVPTGSREDPLQEGDGAMLVNLRRVDCVTLELLDAIELPVPPLQCHGAPSHQRSGHGEQKGPLRGT